MRKRGGALTMSMGTMSVHECPRCGFQTAWKSWPERHPVATVVIAVPTMFTVVSVVLAYPWFFVPVMIVAAAVWIDRRMRRRAAIAARADHEYRELMVAAARGVSPLALRRPRQGRPRGADHWSPTKPITL